MDIFRNRLPSRRDVSLLFAMCVFPVYVWSIVSVLREVPAWTLRLSTWELLGVIAYTQAFALLESAILLLILLALSIILPAKLLKDNLVAQGSMAVLVTTAWAVAAHYNDDAIRLWGLKEFGLGAALYLVSIGVFYVLVHRYERLRRLLCSFVERLAVLSYVYVSIGVLGVFIVVVRNILGALE